MKASKVASFSLIVTLWFVLCLISVALASALTTQVIEQRTKIFSVLYKTGDNCTEEGKNFQIVAVPALGSIVVLWAVHICVFLTNVCYSISCL